VEVRPQSGHYVKLRAASVPAEPEAVKLPAARCVPRMGELVLRVLSAGREPKKVQLGSGAVDPELLPTRRLMKLTAAVARVHAERCVRYEAPEGAKELRTLLARRSVEWGCPMRADEIVITTGAMEAMELSLRATTKAGDAVAVESPTVYWLLQLLEQLGLVVVELPTYPRHGICLDELEAAITAHDVKACLLVPSFNNPLGSCMPDEKRRDLVALLAAKKVTLIEDDVYGDLHHDGARPRPVKAFDERGEVLTCGSFSKTLAPGLRVGFVAAGAWRDRLVLMKGSQTGATATLPQLAVAEFLRSGGYDHHLRSFRRVLRLNLQRLSAVVGETFPEGTRMTRPAGGMFSWVEMPDHVDALALFERADAQRIMFAPGPVFSASGRYRNCLRLSFAQPWTDRFENALRTLGKLAREQART